MRADVCHDAPLKIRAQRLRLPETASQRPYTDRIATVLITGGGGFIGFHLARLHASRGDRVTLVDSLAKGDGAVDADLARLLASGSVHLERIDLATADGAAALAPHAGVDVLYHLAAINGTQLFYEKPYEVSTANLRIMMNVLDAAERGRPGRLVYSSTSEVYADAGAVGLLQVPTDESAPVVFTQPTKIRFSYATSKFMGEFLALRFAEAKGVPTTVIRYHNVYGPRMGHRHVVPELIARIRGGSGPLDVFGLDETRAFCYVADAVEATRLVGALPEAPDLVHIGDAREEIRVEDLTRLLMKLMGIDRPIREAGRRDGSVSRRCPDTTRLRHLTGFTPQHWLAEGLLQTLEWYSAPSA
ncbi:MAG: NAD-dependent epimerase/dehydratase family protein [Chloroflexi bacterium]|nr:NAD-dependent epimerase/dehydratase family protein [Chloroflexota bacterium]